MKIKVNSNTLNESHVPNGGYALLDAGNKLIAYIKDGSLVTDSNKVNWDWVRSDYRKV